MTGAATTDIATAMRNGRWRGIGVAFALLLIGATAAPTNRDLLGLLRDNDARLAMVGERLAVGNAPLCPAKRAWAGMVIHALDQYQPSVRADAVAVFGFPAAVSVEAVLPGGAAADAGVSRDVGVVAIADQLVPAELPRADVPATTARRDAAERAIADLTPGVPVRLVIRAGGADRAVSITPVAGCRARFEVHEQNEAAADGSIVQVGAAYLERFEPRWLPVIVAHELAHIILRHRARLEAAGAKFGALAEFGRSGRLQRQAEEEADRLSVYLLHNAGHDPRDAATFWRGPGKSISGGLFRSRIYPSARDRADSLAAEAAKLPAGDATPVIPDLLALADYPMR